MAASGLWFEQLEPGLRVEHATTRTVTETDNVLFTTMTMNPQPLHLDAEFAAGTEFGRPLVNSLFTLGLVVGLAVPELTLGTTVANLGFSRVDFPAPVFTGDTIHVLTDVLEARRSRSRPSTGIVTFEHHGINQRGETVCIAVRAAMMRCRLGPGGPGPGTAPGTGLTAVPELTAAPKLTRVRSMLFMPGTRADMIAKIPRFAPDVAAVDLEDAVAPGDKDGARRTAADAIDALGPGGVSTVLLRVNPVGSPWFAADIAAAAGCAAAGVVVPKLATRDQVRQVRQALAAYARPGALIIAGIETALGVADARTLLTGELSGAYFGAEDYIADIGGRRSPGGEEVLYARSGVCLAACLAGIPAIDQVVTDIASDGQFLADARRGQALGYQGKMCIHPRQIGLAHEVFTPTPQEVAHARAVVAAGAPGAGLVDGQMVDEVHVRMARAVLARAAAPLDPADPP